MANIIKLALVGISKTGRVITIKDSTGAYDVTTNPGGYGAPNPYSVPTKAVLMTKYWADSAFTPKLLAPADITALEGAGLALGSETAEASSDGVWQYKLLPLKDTTLNGTFTTGSKTVTTTFDITSLGSTGAAYVVALDNSNNLVGSPAKIDWAGINNATTITLVDAWTAALGSYKLFVALEGDLKVLINKAAEACIVSSVGRLAEGNCDDCRGKELAINKLIRWRFAADVKFAKNDFDGAHNIIVAVGKSCGCSN